MPVVAPAGADGSWIPLITLADVRHFGRLRTLVRLPLFRTLSLLLTPSLPRCRWKTTNENAKFEIFEPFVVFFFSHWHVNGFSSKRTAFKEDVLQDRRTCCLRVHPCIFQPGNLTGSGREGVKFGE